jgi:cytochrome c551/c552
MGGNMQTIFRFRWLSLFAAATLAAFLWSVDSPGKSDVPLFHTSDRCEACHNGLSTRSGEDISFGIAWRPTMMANSSRDPYWHAGVRREVLDHPGARAAIEDECSICHMPMSRFESKLAGHEGAVFAHLGFLPDDRGDRLAADGVSCVLCHQIGKDKLGTRESFVGGFTIAPPNAQGDRMSFGPYTPTEGHITIMRTSTGGFIPAESTHLAESEFCATCHTLLTKSLGPDGKVIAEFPEQVPYHEWLHSEFKQTRSCQSCHMQQIQEEVAITTLLGVPRSRVSRHNFLGGNFFMQGILNRNRTELKVESLPDELTAGSQRTVAHLQSEAAKISIGKPELRSGRLETDLTIENLGGHKLPTAYPSRRVWLHLVVRDGSNRVIFESGAVNAEGAIAGNDNDADSARYEPHYTEIRDAGQVQIYEAIMADSKGSVTTGLLHAVRYLKDNRILPRGFDKSTADATIAVAGEALADGDFSGGSDRIRCSIDIGNARGPFRVEAELLYQPISRRWARNLRDYNAEETKRFTRYYDAAAASSSIVLVRTQAEAR